MFKDYKRMFIFDTETSGLNPQPFGEILELGGILLTKEEGEERFASREDIDVLVKNKYPILNSDIHHITAEMCKEDGVTKEKLFELLKGIFGDYSDTLIVAYNSPFDMKFVRAFMEEMSPGYKITNPVLDMLEVARDRTGLYRGNKLCDMLVRYEITDEENSHRALDDCKATLKVMRAFWKEKNDIEKYIRRYNEGI